MSDTDTKSLFQSKTIIGVVIAALPAVAGLLGYKVSDVAAFTSGAEEAVAAIITLVGSAVAIYGRLKATSKLVVKKE